MLTQSSKPFILIIQDIILEGIRFKEDLQSIQIEDGKMSILTRPMVYDMYGTTSGISLPYFFLIHDLPDKYGGSPTDPEVSPLLYPSQAGLPPTFFQIAGLDPLRDEGLLYEKLLREAGVKTQLIMYVSLLITCTLRSCFAHSDHVYLQLPRPAARIQFTLSGAEGIVQIRGRP